MASSPETVIGSGHIENVSMWPYVLLACLFSPLVVGVLLGPAG